MWRGLLLSVLTILAMNSCAAFAQTVVAVPDAGRTTLFAAIVSEQYQVAAPPEITFPVVRTASRAAARPVSVSVTGITPAAAPQLRLLLMANTPSFTTSAGAAAWSAGDITWNAATWANGTGWAGVLCRNAYTTVATAETDAASISTSGLTFTLAGRSQVRRGGKQTLTVTWKIESIGL